MRKNGWQLPYHPLQVVAIAVFLALGFAFYVFFVPFVGKKQFEFVVVGLYTPLVTCVFCLYVCCAATNPADPSIFKSKKYLNAMGSDKQSSHKQSQIEGGSISSKNEAIATTAGDKALENFATTGSVGRNSSNDLVQEHATNCCPSFALVLFGWCLGMPCSRENPSEQHSSEDGMFYCNLCEVEVRKYSKHCRVCDKCVDSFDHHCRWLNNCIGKRNYKLFFILMVSALLLLVLQWSIGILVLVRCFIERKQFNVDIASKLGSSFSLVPFVVVVVSCTILAMIATLPLAQLFFFHVLLIKKGISTYDYIVALREQEQEQQQQGFGGQQSPQMSPLSSVTGLSSASSFNNFHRAAWCTPPRLFLEDQFDVIPPENGSRKRIAMEEHTRKKNNGTIKISPWTLARLNAEEVSKAAAQARKKSRVLQPVMRRETVLGQDKDLNFSGGPSSSGRMSARLENRKRVIKRNRLFTDLPLEPLAKISDVVSDSNGSDLSQETSVSLAPLQLEARSAFQTSRAMSSAGIVPSSPGSSLGSPDLHPFCVSSSGTEEYQGQTNPATVGPATAVALQTGMHLSRSTSDGYEASGGEDSDRVPTRIVPRSSNWSNLLFNSSRVDSTDILRASSLMGLHENMGRPF